MKRKQKVKKFEYKIAGLSILVPENFEIPVEGLKIRSNKATKTIPVKKLRVIPKRKKKVV